MALNKWRSKSGSQANVVLRLETYQEFLDWWPFFLGGHKVLTAPEGANMTDLTTQEFFKTLIELVVYPERGFVAILQNKRSCPLGFIIAHDTTSNFRPKELTMFAIYTNNKCPTTTRELMFELKQWAREQGFQTLRASMFKRSGAALRFYNRVLGLHHTGMSFSTSL